MPEAQALVGRRGFRKAVGRAITGGVIRPARHAVLPAFFVAGLAGAALALPPRLPATPAEAIERAAPGDWSLLDPADLMVMDLGSGRRAVILLADAFAPAHVASIRRLARVGWWDGLAIDRVQDGYVTQWGDQDGTKPLPADAPAHLPAEYDRAAAGLALWRLPYRDTYAPEVGLAVTGGWPVARGKGRAWLAHCYGMVGVGRDNAPDTGSSAELYAVIGHSPRQLDRNIALVGRVVAGMDQLAALPRGTAALGFYATPGERVPIRSVRLAADLPPAERPRLRMLRPDSPAFVAWARLRANRRDAFYVRPAAALDLCNALPPVAPAP